MPSPTNEQNRHQWRGRAAELKTRGVARLPGRRFVAVKLYYVGICCVSMAFLAPTDLRRDAFMTRRHIRKARGRTVGSRGVIRLAF